MAAPTNAANVKKVLANSEPSTHGTKRTWQRKQSSSPFSSSYPLQQPFRRALDLLLSLIDGRYKALAMR
jgi:hypothetical protein